MDPIPSSELDTAVVDELEALGFSLDEAVRLALLHARAGAREEYAEHLAIERRLRFVRWLVEHGRVEE
jgi:hypothetical protein